jgi:hypothetical protein
MAGGISTHSVRAPAWTVGYRGVAISSRIETMVLSIIYTSHVGGAAPELEIELEDRDKRWQGPWFPQRGDLVDVSIGYANAPLAPCPSFQVDEVELRGAPDVVHLRGLAAYITDPMRTPKSASHDGQTLLQTARNIASSYGFSLDGAAVNPDPAFAALKQNQESDLEFLHRIARENNYEFTMRGKRMVFYSRPALEHRPAVGILHRADVLSFEFKAKTHQLYKAAQINYFDPATKSLISHTAEASPAVPTGDTIKLIRRCENGRQAKLKAEAELHRRNMLEATTRLEIPGNVVLTGGAIVTLDGWGTYDGNYFIMTARHKLSRSAGFTTEIEARALNFSSDAPAAGG